MAKSKKNTTGISQPTSAEHVLLRFLQFLDIREKRGNARAITSAYLDFLNIFVLMTFILIVVITFVTAIRVLPITDGWYEALIYLKKQGLVPYKDIEFVLPPVTIVFYQLMDLFTGSNFAANKIIGVVLSLVNAILVYAWLRSECEKSESLLAAFCYFILSTTFPTYISRDYHQLVDLFAIISMILLFDKELYGANQITKKSLLLIVFSGISVQLLMLTKQNVGLTVFVFFVLFLFALNVYYFFRQKKLIRTNALLFLTFCFSFGFTGLIFLAVYNFVFGSGLSVIDFYQYLFGIESKGSPLYIATRVLHDDNNVRIISIAFSLATFMVLLFFVIEYILEKVDLVFSSTGSGGGVKSGRLHDESNVLRRLRALFVVCLFVGEAALIWYVLTSGKITRPSHEYFAVVAVTFYFIDVFQAAGASFRGSKLDPRVCSRIVLFGALIAANTMTASLNIVGTGLVFCYYLGITLKAIFEMLMNVEKAWARLGVVTILLGVITLSVTLEGNKLKSPYAWWGIQEPPVYSGNSKLNLNYLQGLRLDVERARIINDTVSMIKAHSTRAEPIFVYPNIPIFYMLSERVPITRSFVQWFDFARTATLIADFRLISAAPPPVIVEMLIPGWVYSGHEVLLGRDVAAHRAFTGYLKCMVQTRAFEEVSNYLYSKNDVLTASFYLDASKALSSQQIVNLSIAASSLGLENVKVVGAQRYGNIHEIEPMNKIVMKTDDVEIFHTIVVEAKSDQIRVLIQYWSEENNLNFSISNSNLILRVLTRSVLWNERGLLCRDDLRKRLDSLS